MRLILATLVLCAFAGALAAQDLPDNYHDLLAVGQSALEQNDFNKAARAFQRAADINPSSREAHEGLGTALLRMLQADRITAARQSDTVDRAEDHLKQAAQLSPSDPRPLLQLADLYKLLADGSSDAEQKASRFADARHAIESAINLDPNQSELYLRLANLERDEFGPVLDNAKARFSKNAGPIPDEALRKQLQQQYGELVRNAIHNGKAAAAMSSNFQRVNLLLSRLFRQQALLRDTQGEYSVDMQKAADYERQFLAAGGHLSSGTQR